MGYRIEHMRLENGGYVQLVGSGKRWKGGEPTKELFDQIAREDLLSYFDNTSQGLRPKPEYVSSRPCADAIRLVNDNGSQVYIFTRYDLNVSV
jgi:hypothetical protein